MAKIMLNFMQLSRETKKEYLIKVDSFLRFTFSSWQVRPANERSIKKELGLIPPKEKTQRVSETS